MDYMDIVLLTDGTVLGLFSIRSIVVGTHSHQTQHLPAEFKYAENLNGGLHWLNMCSNGNHYIATLLLQRLSFSAYQVNFISIWNLTKSMHQQRFFTEFF